MVEDLRTLPPFGIQTNSLLGPGSFGAESVQREVLVRAKQHLARGSQTVQLLPYYTIKLSKAGA